MWGTRVATAGATVLVAVALWSFVGPGRETTTNHRADESGTTSAESASTTDSGPSLPSCDGSAAAVASPPLVVLRATLDDPTCTVTVWWDRAAAELAVPTGDGQRRRYRLGEPDDQIVLGDWDCDGRATPGVYRASTGATFLFATWPSTTEPEPAVRADNTGITDGVASAVSAAPGTSCQQLQIDP